MNHQESLAQLFRTEYRKIVSVLSKAFGIENIQIAEDIVSDAFLKANESWTHNGIPDNPGAWLYTVAKNQARDFLRREKLRREKVEKDLYHQTMSQEKLEIDLSESNIQDSQLKMMFAICHPSLPRESQIILALRILCGLGIEEIASALLMKKETVQKRLYRAKADIAKKNIPIQFPIQLKPRLENVWRTLYLLFNEGYYSASKNIQLRQELCLEAMHLALLLLDYPPTRLPPTYALLSLMCFHSSRLAARTNIQGQTILYADQNRDLWDQELIQQGEHFLNQSANGDQLHKYHLEAGIAYWHTQEDHIEKWENILQLYNYLLQVEYSPTIALNRTYALFRANGKVAALRELQKLNMEGNHFFHALLAEIYQSTEPGKAQLQLQKALKCCPNEREKLILENKYQQLSHKDPD